MNVPTISMDRKAAREQLRAYRTGKHRELDTEYRAVEAGLAALARGTRIINLSEAIRAGGFDELGRPRLAIARSDQVRVEFWQGRESRARFQTNMSVAGWRMRGRSQTYMRFVDLERTPEKPIEAYAMVPMVPAPVLTEARVRGRLANYFTLFEVERWATRAQFVGPDRDPYLLRHLGGELYAVIAEWDLTELERAVMAARGRSEAARLASGQSTRLRPRRVLRASGWHCVSPRRPIAWRAFAPLSPNSGRTRNSRRCHQSIAWSSSASSRSR